MNAEDSSWRRLLDIMFANLRQPQRFSHRGNINRVFNTSMDSPTTVVHFTKEIFVTSIDVPILECILKWHSIQPMLIGCVYCQYPRVAGPKNRHSLYEHSVTRNIEDSGVDIMSLILIFVAQLLLLFILYSRCYGSWESAYDSIPFE